MSSEEEKFLVEGLNFNIDEQVLEDHFSSFGPISEVVVVKDRETQRPQGFYQPHQPRRCSDATKAKNGECLDGRQIHVEHAGKSDQAPEGMSLGPMDMVTGRVGGNQGYGSGQYDS
ncbi:RNA-binding protein 3 [Sciurus carolinensis]|uniref:RNA-binding protein 3 n=1 Tax=Sciurus carolinensis TaxID=30640 RepID=A0AA41N3J8_SCICA|nr:RNA-binding protein 3 [Sciurus carolinensis]